MEESNDLLHSGCCLSVFVVELLASGKSSAGPHLLGVFVSRLPVLTLIYLSLLPKSRKFLPSLVSMLSCHLPNFCFLFISNYISFSLLILPTHFYKPAFL